MGKNKTGMTLIIILLVILLILFGVGFASLYKVMNKANMNFTSNAVFKGQISMEDVTNFSLGDPIVTNLLEGSDKKRHVIKISASLGINTNKKVAKEAEALLGTLEAQKVVIKDIIIGVCRSKTFEELNKSDARQILKDEILLNLQNTFDNNLILDVYIDEIFLD